LGNGGAQRNSTSGCTSRRPLHLLGSVTCHVYRVPGLLPFPGSDLLTLAARAAPAIQDRRERAHEPAAASAGDRPFSCVTRGRTSWHRARIFRVADRREDGPGPDFAAAIIYESARHMTSPSASSSIPMPGYCFCL